MTAHQQMLQPLVAVRTRQHHADWLPHLNINQSDWGLRPVLTHGKPTNSPDDTRPKDLSGLSPNWVEIAAVQELSDGNKGQIC